MKSLLEFRTARVAVAVAAVAAAGLTASLGTTSVATAQGKPDVAIERKAASGSKADERRPINRAKGRKVG